MCPVACALHRPPPLNTHPETSSRAAAVASAVRAATVEQLRDGRVAWVEEVRHPLSLHDPVLRFVHTDRHIAALTQAFETLRLFPEEMGPPSASAPTFGIGNATEVDRREAFYFDTDTPAALGTEEAVLAAAGTAIDAVNSVLVGDCINAFCITRPPGHHAEADRAMGFCFLNNAALGAIYALENRENAASAVPMIVCPAAFHEYAACCVPLPAHCRTDADQVSRVAIIDFDVHHGNGTADIAARREKTRRDLGLETDLLFLSTHEHPLYPMTGAMDAAPDAGAVRNFILDAGTNSDAWRRLYETHVLPCLADWAPDLVILSAGFDAHSSDPLANCELHSRDFEWVTRELIKCSGGRAVSVLEGGYQIESLRECAVHHVQGLLQGGSM